MYSFRKSPDALIVVPLFYVLFDDAAEAVKRAFRRISGGGAPEIIQPATHPAGSQN